MAAPKSPHLGIKLNININIITNTTKLITGIHLTGANLVMKGLNNDIAIFAGIIHFKITNKSKDVSPNPGNSNFNNIGDINLNRIIPIPEPTTITARHIPVIFLEISRGLVYFERILKSNPLEFVIGATKTYTIAECSKDIRHRFIVRVNS